MVNVKSLFNYDCICHCRDSPGYPHDHRLSRGAPILFGRHNTGGAAGGFPSDRPVFTEYDEIVLTARDIIERVLQTILIFLP